jgi:carboxymethylenebutenolidase
MNTNLGGVAGHLAKPSGKGPWPALIVIHEWWGLDEQTRRIADRFAEKGYLAFAPDLFGGELAALGDNAKATGLVQKYATGSDKSLCAVYDAIRKLPDAGAKVGSVGFCFGGRMSLLLGINRPLDAVCTFYGGGMQTLFGDLHRLRAPVLGLFGDADLSIPAGTIEKFDQLLGENGNVHEIKVYADSGHAFFRDSDPQSYRPTASADAWVKATGFFAAHLR